MSDRTYSILTQLSLNNADFQAGINKVKGNVKDLVLGVKGATGNISEMQRALNALKNQSFAGKSLEDIKAIKDRIKSLNVDIKKFQADTSGAGSSVSGAFGGLTKMFKGFAPALAVGAIVGSLGSIGSKIIEVRSEFANYEAVLKNALGSQSAANKAFGELQNFAAKTPFALNELTSSYVKLTNQGFQPTMEEMTKLGDLASSMGKPFDQLAEAVIDAQVGENERLKEFGIRAQKDGDKIIYTFKGVQTVVDNNASAIQNYILSLGNLEGVQGAMAEQSKTLGGAISNAKDSINTLLNEVGKKLEPLLVSIITGFSDFMNTISSWVKTSGNLFRNLYNWFADFYNNSTLLRAEVEQLGVVFSTVFNVIKMNFQSLFNILGTAAKLIKAVFTGNFDDIGNILKESADKQKAIYTEAGTKIAENVKKAFNRTLNGKIELKVAPVVDETATNNVKKKVNNLKTKTGQEKAYSLDNDVDYFEKLKKLNQDYLDGKIESEKEYNDQKDRLEAEALSKAISSEKYKGDDLIKIEKNYQEKLIAIKNKEQFGSIASVKKVKNEPGLAVSFDNLTERTKNATSDLKTQMEEFESVALSIADSVGQGFNELGNKIVESFGLASSGFEGFLGVMLSGAVELLSMLLSNAIASAISAAAVAAGGTGIAAPFALPAFIATMVGTVFAAFAAIPKFAYGGIIPGSSYSGDNVPIMANSGEMILNSIQQKNLFNMLNTSNSGYGKEVVFRIQGTELVGVLNNHSRKINSIR